MPPMTDSSSGDSSPWHPDPLGVVGRVIARRYPIAGCLNTGGMSAIYLARSGEVEVVVKLMTVPESSDAVLRFEREAANLSRIRHPNVVRILDHGRCADTGLLYIVMEWVRGETLKRHLKLWGPCPLEEFEDLAAQILDGVSEAHRRQVIHRDLKASNVMITSHPDGRPHVTLLDFGLSEVSALQDAPTETEGLVGSPMTIAPEQLRGEASDARADVYALGVMFYQMLTGKRPYPGRSAAAVFTQQAGGEHIPFAEALGDRVDVPAAAVRLIERCLSADPSRRPSDANVLRRQLIRALGTQRVDRTHLWGAGILLVLVAAFVTTCALIVS